MVLQAVGAPSLFYARSCVPQASMRPVSVHDDRPSKGRGTASDRCDKATLSKYLFPLLAPLQLLQALEPLLASFSSIGNGFQLCFVYVHFSSSIAQHHQRRKH